MTHRPIPAEYKNPSALARYSRTRIRSDVFFSSVDFAFFLFALGAILACLGPLAGTWISNPVSLLSPSSPESMSMTILLGGGAFLGLRADGLLCLFYTTTSVYINREKQIWGP